MNIELQMGLFKGFYGSFIDARVDENIDNDLSENDLNYDDCDVDYNYKELAEDIFDFAKYELYSELDFLSDLEFSELVSPKYYNSSNDKIYFKCNIDKDKFIDWLIDLTTNGGEVWDVVSGEIEEQHTSCSGFTSFHSNKISDWVKDLIAFDLDDDKTVYKIGFIISEYIRMTKIYEDYNWDFEDAYLYNGNYSGHYSCYSIKELNS